MQLQPPWQSQGGFFISLHFALKRAWRKMKGNKKAPLSRGFEVAVWTEPLGQLVTY
jgi:hypothetical protein